MYWLRLTLRNTLRHPLRTVLTLVGLLVAILSFGLLQTVVDAWYTGANAAAPDRLVTRIEYDPTLARELLLCNTHAVLGYHPVVFDSNDGF